MKILIAIAVAITLFSCNNSSDQTSQASAVVVIVPWTDSHANPVKYSTGATDTTIEFQVYDVGEGGSVLNLHYTNDTIIESTWYINSDTGQVQVKYAFGRNGIVGVKQINVRFPGPIIDLRGGKTLPKDSLSYTMDINGEIKSPADKEYLDVYRDFRKRAPLILTRH